MTLTPHALAAHISSFAHSSLQSIFGATVFQELLFAFEGVSLPLAPHEHKCMGPWDPSYSIRRFVRRIADTCCTQATGSSSNPPPVPVKKENRRVLQDLIGIKPCGTILVDFLGAQLVVVPLFCLGPVPGSFA